MELKGQTVMITGGASGLGQATARRFHGAGARVVINALAAVGDGPLRVVVHCAGIAPPRRILGRENKVHDLDSFQRVINVNLVGTFNVLRLAADAMRDNDPLEGDRGVIVMTASIAAFDGQIGQAAYSASKAGVHGLTLTAARDLAEY